MKNPYKVIRKIGEYNKMYYDKNREITSADPEGECLLR